MKPAGRQVCGSNYLCFKCCKNEAIITNAECRFMSYAFVKTFLRLYCYIAHF